jgi:hypothetical protein
MFSSLREGVAWSAGSFMKDWLKKSGSIVTQKSAKNAKNISREGAIRDQKEIIGRW